MSCLELRFVNFLLNEYCIVLYCITMEKQNFALLNSTIAAPIHPPFPKIGVSNAPQIQLRDACCHLANMTQGSDKTSVCSAGCQMSRAMLSIAKSLWPLFILTAVIFWCIR